MTPEQQRVWVAIEESLWSPSLAAAEGRQAKIAQAVIDAYNSGPVTAHELRVSELLEHANQMEQRARDERARADAAEAALLACARVCGAVATIRLKD